MIRLSLVAVSAAIVVTLAFPVIAQEKAAEKSPGLAKAPEVVDSTGYAAVVARHRGKPVMVNFWATWCVPCRDELPMVNELAKKYADRGLVVIGVSVDDDGELTMVRRFLGRLRLEFPNYRKKMGDFEAFNASVDPKWRGTIPATFFYGRDGKLAASLVGAQKREDFEQQIQELLARREPR